MQTPKPPQSPALAGPPPGRSLVGEMRVFMLVIPAAIVIAIQVLSLFGISAVMTADLRRRAVETADETGDLLEGPLYNVDDEQARRIGEALLSSGRISGIRLESLATGSLLEKGDLRPDSLIPSARRSIARGEIRLGEVVLFFSDGEIRTVRRLLAILSALVVLAVVLASWIVSSSIVRHRLQEPLEAIIGGIDAVAEGEYEKPVPATPYADVNYLVRIVNDMAGKVRSKSRELREVNALLEARVVARTVELEKSLAELGQAQNHLVQSEKLSALGHLSASIAHELNTPIAAILSSVQSIAEYFDLKSPQVLAFLGSLDEGQRSLYHHLVELGFGACGETGGLGEPRPGRAQAARLREKLRGWAAADVDAILEGILELGIADKLDEVGGELGIPRAGDIVAWANEPVSARRMAAVASLAAGKAAGVVTALRSYLAPESSIASGKVDVVRNLETVLTLLHGVIKNGVRIHRDLRPAFARGSAEQLDRVWMNLILNAVQAMGYGGELSLGTLARDGRVIVTIGDSGPGIPEAIQGRIFEPFFTTKQEGEGMGLGLGIAHGILVSHGGSISFDSRPGRTVFTVELPAYVD